MADERALFAIIALVILVVGLLVMDLFVCPSDSRLVEMLFWWGC